MIAILCATCAGVTIVLSRSVNGYLSQKIGAYQSTFFNYFTGFLMSSVFLILFGFFNLKGFQFDILMRQPTLLIGGMIGVFNILILNIIVPKISPVQLTLITFVAQLLSGVVIDYCIYDIFSIQKLIGCLIVIVGLIAYQLSDE
ncbi:DMT family transporter [Longibaculum muris]|uniref:DMT family transporter n=1 Tax=Longibaculum muris TaxID=1796628 RepID=UPI00189D37C5|nr:DMT family transporter [Longibaculum muris]